MQFTPTPADYLILIVFGLLSLLSGWFTFLLFYARTPERRGPLESSDAVTAACHMTLVETILLVMINTIVITSFILLLTAQLGVFRFRHWCLFFLLYLLAIITFLFASGKLRPFAALLSPRLVKSDWGFLPLAALALWTFNPPSEAIHTRDPGAYANIAVKISEVAALKFRDPDYEKFNSRERQSLFLPFSLDKVAYPQVIPGFHLVDPASGQLTPRYFHLFPIWLALAFKLWRFAGIFMVNIFLGLLSVLVLVPLGEHLLGSRLLGFLAASLLALNLAQIWTVRSPFSEILTQFLLLAGLWTLCLGMTQQHSGFCKLAGLLFGLALFVRVDSALVLVALLLFSYVTFLAQRKAEPLSFPLLSFLIPLAGMTAYAALHSFYFANPYMETVLNTFHRIPLSIGSVFVLLGGLITLSLPAARKGLVRMGERNKKTLVIAGCVVLTSLFAYGYFVRPLKPGAEVISLPFPLTGDVPYYDEISLVRLGWYVSPFGILLAYVGTMIALHRWVRTGATQLAPFLLTLAIFAGFYLYHSRAFPDNYWVIRRYIEVVIPGFLLLISLALRSLWEALARITGGERVYRLASATMCAAAFLVVGLWPLKTAYAVLTRKEWQNTFPQLENLAGANQDADILLLERGQFQDFFSSPLKFVFHKSVYPLASDEPDVEAFESEMEEWTRQGKRVNLLASEERTTLLSPRYEFVPIERFRFQTQIVESTYERLPHFMDDLRFTVQLYRVKKRLEPQDPTSISVNLGYHFGFSATGFYNLELSNEYEPFRWAGGQSSIELPGLKGSEDALLLLRLRRELPVKLAGEPVKIFFNNRLVGEPRLSPQFQVVEFPVPNSLFHARAVNTIRFSSGTYNAARSGSSNDTRDLGFMVHWLKLQLLTPVSSQHPYSLDVGAQSDEIDAKLIGFYPREPASFRWCEPVARVELARPFEPGSDLKLSLRALKASPIAGFRQFLNVSINGRNIGRTELLDHWDEFRTYHFLIPKTMPYSPKTVIALEVNPPLHPASSDVYTDDWRPLGCAVDWLKISGGAVN
jgi:hypothetical protein